MVASPYREIMLVCMVVLCGYWILSRRETKSTKLIESRPWNLVHNGLMALGFALAWPTIQSGTVAARFVAQGPVLQAVGTALVVAGVALAIWARRVLGTNWSAAVTIKEGHGLIRRGPYAIVRNPIYTGDVVIVLGMALALGEVRGLVGLVLMVVGVWSKGRAEERFLLAEFGDEYAAYQRDVGFLLPRVV
jgi:protein-S-isoprenylcysteine O-methyltransferase Ste14